MRLGRWLRAGLRAGALAAGIAAVVRAGKARRDRQSGPGWGPQGEPWPVSPSPAPHRDVTPPQQREQAGHAPPEVVPPGPSVVVAPAVVAAAAEPAPEIDARDSSERRLEGSGSGEEEAEMERAEPEAAMRAEAAEAGAPVETASRGDSAVPTVPPDREAPDREAAAAIAEEGGKATQQEPEAGA